MQQLPQYTPVRKHGEMSSCNPPSFIFLFIPECQPIGWCCPHLGWTLYSQLNLSGNTIILPSRGVSLGYLNPDKLTVDINHHTSSGRVGPNPQYNALFTLSFVYRKFSILLALSSKKIHKEAPSNQYRTFKNMKPVSKVPLALLFFSKCMSFPFSVL